MQYFDKVVADFFVQFIKVADVPVIVQRQAPAVHVRERGGVPAPVHRLSGGSVAFTETGMHSANCAKDRRFARCSSLTGWDTRCCTTTGAWV